MSAGNRLREIAADITKRCTSGEFGGRHSLLRARMDAHAVRLWGLADAVDPSPVRQPSRREVAGYSPWHRLRVWLRGALGLRGGVHF